MILTIKKKTLAIIVMAGVFLLLALMVGFRDLDTGGDGLSYARHYYQQAGCKCFTDMEIGFEILTYPVSFLSLGLVAYFTFISAVIFLLTYRIVVGLASLTYQGGKTGVAYVLVLCAMMGVFLLNPLYAQIHTNALRHGLSALSVGLCAVLAMRRNQKQALICSAVAVMFHWSALLYIPLIPLASERLEGFDVPVLLTFVALPVFYMTGTSEAAVKLLLPAVHQFVYAYGEEALQRYGFGPRLDFTLFTVTVGLACYALTQIPVFRSYRWLKRFAVTGIAMTFPFFIFGWGVFSNRYLLTPWVVFSIIGAAMLAVMLKGWRGASAVAFSIFVAGLSLFAAWVR